MTRSSLYLRAAVLFAFLLFANCASACDRAAGVVPFAVVDGQVLVLIADHKINKQRGWAGFGGCVDKDESLAAAALRELHEETRCALDQQLSINPDTPRVSFGKFTSFALEVPFISETSIQTKKLPSHCRGPVIHERGPWAWVALPSLLKQISGSNDNEPFSDDFLPFAATRWFWGKSSRVIKALNDQHAFTGVSQ